MNIFAQEGIDKKYNFVLPFRLYGYGNSDE